MSKTLAMSDHLGADDLSDTESWEWFAVIAFHPETSRIGETASQDLQDGPFTLGRQSPVFSPFDGLSEGQGARPDNSCGLDDPYVSREACTLLADSSSSPAARACHDQTPPDELALDRADERAGYLLRRPPGASLLRVNDEVVEGDRWLSTAQLQSGVVINLAQRVVIHLRLQSRLAESPTLAGAQRRLIGVSRAMQQLQRDLARVAQSADDVLLLGDTGTGKELVARTIHALSARERAPWVAVNMAALPADIAAASLFGVRRGAYTGADANRSGYFQQAEGGTLFLDEIGDTPESLQPMLLRALQERELQVVGGPTQSVDVRVIAATERDPDAAETSMRAALRYRLAAQELRLPTLRERAEDIGALAAHFISNGQACSAWSDSIADAAVVARWTRCFEHLLLYGWPGNVRELQHAVRQIALASDHHPVVPRALLQKLTENSSRGNRAGTEPCEVTQTSPRHADARIEEPAAGPSLMALPDSEFQAVWRACDYEVSAVARQFSVSRATVYRKLRSSEGCRLAADVPLGELLASLDRCEGDLAATARELQISVRGLETRLRASGVRAALNPGS